MIDSLHNRHLQWGVWIREHILNAHVQRGCETELRRVQGLGPAACCVTDSLVFLHVRDIHFMDELGPLRSPPVVGDCAMCTFAHVPLSVWPPKKSFWLSKKVRKYFYSCKYHFKAPDGTLYFYSTTYSLHLYLVISNEDFTWETYD